jgi:hypothetical protein
MGWKAFFHPRHEIFALGDREIFEEVKPRFSHPLSGEKPSPLSS